MPSGWAIGEYTDGELAQLVRWLKSDGRLRTDEELLADLVRELGFQRRGSRIVPRLQRAIERARATSRPAA